MIYCGEGVDFILKDGVKLWISGGWVSEQFDGDYGISLFMEIFLYLFYGFTIDGLL